MMPRQLSKMLSFIRNVANKKNALTRTCTKSLNGIRYMHSMLATGDGNESRLESIREAVLHESSVTAQSNVKHINVSPNIPRKKRVDKVAGSSLRNTHALVAQ